MTVTTVHATSTAEATSPWRGFRTGLWQYEINVRDFIQQNYEPYDGDGRFLAPATARTQKIWEMLKKLFVEERKRGVLDIHVGEAAHEDALPALPFRAAYMFRPDVIQPWHGARSKTRLYHAFPGGGVAVAVACTPPFSRARAFDRDDWDREAQRDPPCSTQAETRIGRHLPAQDLNRTHRGLNG
jgi:hypothetical protein